TPAPARAPHAYTPPHLAEKILTSRSALAGERKQVTVLFADIKGSTGLDHGMGHLATLRPEKNERLPPIKVETKGRPHHPEPSPYTGEGLTQEVASMLSLLSSPFY